MPLLCTTPVYCYTKRNTTISTTKCRYLALHQYTVTQIATQRYLPQNAVTLHYTSILLHKHQHSGIYHKMPLPCTAPVYCYRNTNTTVSPTKYHYLALHQYTLTQTPTQQYRPQNPVTLHYTSILLHKQIHNGIYHKIPLPCTTPIYCYTKSNTTVYTTKCRYHALHQYTVTQTPTQNYLPQNAVTLHYTGILLHKQQHNGIYHKKPLPCTTPVYCNTNSNTAISSRKCCYLALHQYTVTRTPTQRYLPHNAVTLHYTSILLHKHQHSSIYHKMPLPCSTPLYC